MVTVFFLTFSIRLGRFVHKGCNPVMLMDEPPLTYSLLNSSFNAAVRELINLNAHCGTVFFLSDKKDVHLL